MSEDLVHKKLRDVSDFEWQRFPRVYGASELQITEQLYSGEEDGEVLVEGLGWAFIQSPTLHFTYSYYGMYVSDLLVTISMYVCTYSYYGMYVNDILVTISMYVPIATMVRMWMTY